jgi:hypothetical protein
MYIQIDQAVLTSEEFCKSCQTNTLTPEGGKNTTTFNEKMRIMKGKAKKIYKPCT